MEMFIVRVYDKLVIGAGSIIVVFCTTNRLSIETLQLLSFSTGIINFGLDPKQVAQCNDHSPESNVPSQSAPKPYAAFPPPI